ncbi:MAG: hypothetical protein H8E18_01315 [FCB group bacterium]|nr:hypothetical protein [FCB group bacterium]
MKKSVEGSTAFFVSTTTILILFYPEAIIINILIAGIVTLAEAYPMHLDDNFLIPILSGTLLSFASLL